MLSTVLFLLAYLFLLAAGTLFVAGWFFITRGWSETLPDGKTVRRGKIFSGWYFFWMQERATKTIYFQGKELRKLVTLFQYRFGEKLRVFDAAVMVIGAGGFQPLMQELADSLDFYWVAKGDGYYSLARDVPQYRFPEWVRAPLATCATCFASVYGSLFYWTSLFIFGDFCQLPILAMLVLWIYFCLSLAVTVTAVAKKYN